MPDQLKFGLSGINGRVTSYPEALVNSHRQPNPPVSNPYGRESILSFPSPRHACQQPHAYSILCSLAFVAAHTSTIRLGTGVLLLPQHQPLILAKELATLDVLSGGRLIVGIGVGWSEEEYEALGVTFHDRGARADEYLAAMRAIWSEDKPAYHGKYVSFQGVQAYPHPIQQPAPPIITGGRAPSVIRRTIEQANGWYGFALDLEETADVLAELRQASERYHRPASLGELEISIAPSIPIDKETAQRFAGLGVHRIIFIPPPGKDATTLVQWVTTLGETLVGQV